MERPELRADVGVIERCRECLGHVVQSDGEYVCTSCGLVARKVEGRERFHLEVHIRAPNALGSFMGTKDDADSHADFNGHSTVAHAKRISDLMALEDSAETRCAGMARRVADRLSLPPFVAENAVTLSKKVLAEVRANRENGGRRVFVSAVAAYSLVAACREAGVGHVATTNVTDAVSDMGRKVTKSALLRLGLESSVVLTPVNPESLLGTLMSSLEKSPAVLKRLRKNGAEPGPYFRRLLQASRTVLGALRDIGEGRNPRTIAAVSVYVASREMEPRAVTQRELAEIAGVTEYTVRDFCASVTRKVGPSTPSPS